MIRSGDWDGLQIRWCLAAQRFDSSSPAFIKSVNCEVMLLVSGVGVRLSLGFKAKVRELEGSMVMSSVREGKFVGESVLYDR